MILFQALTVAEASFRIEAMVMQDQEARFRMIGMKPNDPKREVVAELSRIDREDTAQMRQIVDQFGWPTISKFGAKTAGDAWLLVQHADLDHPFQRRCLALMKPLLTKKEVSGQNYAYLFDRVSVADTGKQLYGTQCKIERGKVTLIPVLDRERLDSRRKGVGMMPIAQYLKLVADMYLSKH